MNWERFEGREEALDAQFGLNQMAQYLKLWSQSRGDACRLGEFMKNEVCWNEWDRIFGGVDADHFLNFGYNLPYPVVTNTTRISFNLISFGLNRPGVAKHRGASILSRNLIGCFNQGYQVSIKNLDLH